MEKIDVNILDNKYKRIAKSYLIDIFKNNIKSIHLINGIISKIEVKDSFKDDVDNLYYLAYRVFKNDKMRIILSNLANELYVMYFNNKIDVLKLKIKYNFDLGEIISYE